MSSGSILPTFGPAPPNIRRATIPRELQPELPSALDALRAPRKSEPEPVEEPAPQQESSFGSEEQENGQAGGQEGRPLGASAAVSAQVATPSPPPPTTPSEGTSRIRAAVEEAAAPDPGVNASGLTDEEEAYVRELQAIDREVRAHEAAHAAAGGAYAGRPSYEYVTGPDGIRYAVSGTVEIDVSTVPGDPAATIDKLEVVRRAANAPAQPSAQDRAVAAQAEVGIREAEADLREERAEEARERQEAVAGDGEAADDGSLVIEAPQAADSDTDAGGESATPDFTAGSPVDTATAAGLFEQAATTAPGFASERPALGVDLLA